MLSPSDVMTRRMSASSHSLQKPNVCATSLFTYSDQTHRCAKGPLYGDLTTGTSSAA